MGQICGLYQVDQSTIAIKERCGKFDKVDGPGCHCVPWCCCVTVAGVLSLRVQQLDVRCETKTKVWASVPRMLLDDVFEQKNEIAKNVAEELEKVMHTYGYEIVQTLIVDIEPDETVKRAMNEINAAARMRAATNEKAEGEKILQVKQAEGEAEARYLSGVGVARQRQAIVDGLQESVLAFANNVPGTSPKEVMDMVLVTQYFDTLKEIGSNSRNTAVFIPHGPGAVRDVAEQIRNGLLQGDVAGIAQHG
ncbi:unnamed protein product [Sphagnum jensenii]